MYAKHPAGYFYIHVQPHLTFIESELDMTFM